MIMNQQPFSCGNVDSLVSYLYDEITPAERREVESHLARCSACAEEIAGLKATRGVLATWAPPEVELGFRIVQDPPARVVPIAASRRWAWRSAPIWLQAAAAVVLLASAAAITNLQVRYDDRGVTVTTGWNHPAAAVAQATPVPAQRASAATFTTDSAPWRHDLAALEQQLRHDIATSRPAPAAASGSSLSQSEMLQEVKLLLQQSEERQQRELALHLAQVVRDVDSQRRADLVRIESNLGQMQGTTGVEVAQQRQLLNYLVRVSQQK